MYEQVAKTIATVNRDYSDQSRLEHSLRSMGLTCIELKSSRFFLDAIILKVEGRGLDVPQCVKVHRSWYSENANKIYSNPDLLKKIRDSEKKFIAPINYAEQFLISNQMYWIIFYDFIPGKSIWDHLIPAVLQNENVDSLRSKLYSEKEKCIEGIKKLGFN